MASSYSTVWDLCCDHGLIGYACLRENPEAEVYFVDRIDKIMAQLQTKAQASWPSEYLSRSTFFTQDAKSIQLKNSSHEVAIIAGIGGHLACQMIEQILNNIENPKTSFITSVHRDAELVSSTLITHGYHEVFEQQINDKKHDYRILKWSRI
jgi:tRNA (adenine22-N1)-methyltransferase